MTWENGVLGMIPAEEWLSVPFTPPTIPTDPIDALFGNEKTDNITARWDSISADQLIPAMAQFHAFDVEANKTVSPVLDNHMVEKGLIKVKKNQSERMQQLLKQGVRNDDELYRYVIEDGARLARQVDTRVRVAKNEVLATGKATIGENNLNLTIDYGVTDEQTGFTLVITPDSDAPAQIQKVIDAANEMGVTITGMLTSSKVVTRLRNNLAVQKAINGNNGAGALVRNAALKDYLADEFGITTLITQDNVYNANNEKIDAATGRLLVSSKRYYPENKITFFAATPNGKLGVGLWGDPPEVVNPLIETQGSNVNPYVYISQWTEHDPAVLWTKASSLFVPVLYNPSSLFIATVTDEVDEGE